MTRGTALLVSFLLAGQAVSAEPVDIGDRRELFVDTFLIDSLDGAMLKLHHPQPAPPCRQPLPVLGSIGSYIYGTVFRDGDLYRFYGRRDATGHPQTTVYAESRDGINWVEPMLGIHDVPWVPAGNVILHREGKVVHNFTPFVDTNPATPPEEKYKAVGGACKTDPDSGMEAGLYGYASHDGIHWKRIRPEPIIPVAFLQGRPGFDSQNLAFWSESQRCYVCYFRVFNNRYSPGVRSVRRTTSADFVHWTDPVDVRLNRPRPGGTNRYGHRYEQLYVNNIKPYFRASHLYVGLPTRINFDRNAPSEIVLATSRDGIHFARDFDEPFHRPGPTGSYGNRGHYFCHQVIQTGPAEMSFYSYRPRRYVMRLDGFASLGAPFEGGRMTTRPLTFLGSQLEINAQTAAIGWIAIEVQDDRGQPIPGFALDDCDRFTGDRVAHVMSWNGSADLSRLSARAVRLRFVLKDADVYSFRFHDNRPARGNDGS